MQSGAIAYVLAGVCCLSEAAFNSCADPLDDWQWRSPLPQGNALRGVAYGDGRLVVVGDGGAMLTSADGISWELQNSGSAQALNGVAWGNGIFVAVGQGGTLMTSVDGTAWTKHESNTTNDLSTVSFGKDIFVAAGIRGTIITSRDGRAWTKLDLGTNGLYAGFSAVTFGDEKFVAVGYRRDPGYILVSTNGTTWRPAVALPGYPAVLQGVIFSEGTFLGVGRYGMVVISANGMDWSARSSSACSLPLAACFLGMSLLVVMGAYLLSSNQL